MNNSTMLIRKKDGHRIYVDMKTYREIKVRKALREISVENFEEDINSRVTKRRSAANK